jgi:transposase
VPDEVRAEPEAYEKIAEEYHDELEAIPPQLYWARIVREKYRRKAARNQPPLIAPAPPPSIPGTLIGPGLAAQIVVDKYVDHLPHYRQSARFWRRHRAEVSRQTINQWTHAIAAHLNPIGAAIKAELTDCWRVADRRDDRLIPETRTRADQDRILLGVSGSRAADRVLRLADEPGS